MANMYKEVNDNWFIIDDKIFELGDGNHFTYFGTDLKGYRLNIDINENTYVVRLIKGNYQSPPMSFCKLEATRIVLVEFIDHNRYVGAKFDENVPLRASENWCDSYFYNSFRIHPKKFSSVEDIMMRTLDRFPTVRVNKSTTSKAKKGFYGVSLFDKSPRLEDHQPYLKSALLYALYHAFKDTGVPFRL